MCNIKYHEDVTCALEAKMLMSSANDFKNFRDLSPFSKILSIRSPALSKGYEYVLRSLASALPKIE